MEPEKHYQKLLAEAEAKLLLGNKALSPSKVGSIREETDKIQHPAFGFIRPEEFYKTEDKGWTPIPPTPDGIDKTLEERGKRYGDFIGHAYITQKLKDSMKCSEKWESLPPDMKESLEMIAHKIGRILNGDPFYKDSWTDIIGYARLVEQKLRD